MEISYSFHVDNIGFHVSNTGIGLARIEAANVTYNGTKIEGWATLADSMQLDRNVEQETSGISNYTSSINEHVLPPNTRYNDILRLDFPNLEQGNKTVYQNFRREIQSRSININVCYCSVYDECWTTTMIDESKEELAPGSQRPIESSKEIESSNI